MTFIKKKNIKKSYHKKSVKIRKRNKKKTCKFIYRVQTKLPEPYSNPDRIKSMSYKKKKKI